MNKQFNRTFEFTELGFKRFLDLLRRFSTIKCDEWQEHVNLLRFAEMPGFTPVLAQTVFEADFRTMIIVIFDNMVDVPGYGVCNFICLDQFRDTEKIATGSVSDTERKSLLSYFNVLNVEMQNQKVN